MWINSQLAIDNKMKRNNFIKNEMNNIVIEDISASDLNEIKWFWAATVTLLFELGIKTKDQLEEEGPTIDWEEKEISPFVLASINNFLNQN